MLKVKQLKISYGGILAVKGIDLEVHSGELVSLIGSNGAGKTSTLKAIAGMITHQSGEVMFDEVLSSGKSYELLARGMALVPEGRGIFTRMTVLENLQMGAYLRKDSMIESDLEKMYVFFPRIKERLSQLAGTLSGGEQQMVAMARALMTRPKLLLLDEPSMGLSPILVDTIFEVIEKIAKDGMTILLVEQNAQRALEISDRAYVLASGQVSMTGRAEDLMKDPRVSAAYLGA
ncbi:ABC transporter ATP-binding protein [Polynucleobacter rarus]|uniref:ABC transporter ATP-binding protein n=1 Tax=Polynucleobacter rarus TaxID=556055 RepID=UPI000D3EB2A2|nr:ABC transporter ATP-binding protein [Polynucleobacter rarus]